MNRHEHDSPDAGCAGRIVYLNRLIHSDLIGRVDNHRRLNAKRVSTAWSTTTFMTDATGRVDTETDPFGNVIDYARRGMDINTTKFFFTEADSKRSLHQSRTTNQNL